MSKNIKKLTVKDQKIIAILRKDCRQTDSDIAKTVQLTRQTVAARIRRLEEEGVIRAYETVIRYQALNLIQHELFITFNSFAGTEKQHIIHYFAEHPFVRWMAELFGEPHLRISIVTGSVEHFAQVLGTIEQDLRNNIRNIQVTTVLGRVRDRTERENYSQSNADIDEKDVEILQILSTTPRITLTELATKVHLSIEGVRQRKHQLEETKVITKYTTTINFKLAGEQAWCILFIKFKSRKDTERGALYTFLAQYPETSNIDLLLGDWHMSITFSSSNIYRVNDIIAAFTEEFANTIATTNFYLHLTGHKYPKVPEGMFDLLRERHGKTRENKQSLLHTSPTKVLVFDWDGTCLDSVSLKARAFRKTFEEHLPAAKHAGQLAEAAYLVTGGTLRQQQLAAAAAMAGVPTLEGAAYDAWSEAFSLETLKQKPQLFRDVMPALLALKKKGAYLAISSSMPQEDLDASINYHPAIRKILNLVLGTRNKGAFRKGKPHLDKISKLTGMPVRDIMFIGDMPEDMRRGKEAGAIAIARLPKNSPQLEKQLKELTPEYTIHTFDELLRLV